MDPSLTSVRSVLKSAPLYPKSSSQVHPNPHPRNAVSGSEVMPATVRGSLKPTVHRKINAAVRGSLKSAVHREIHAAVRGSLKSAVRGESKAATSLKPPPSVAPSSLPFAGKARLPPPLSRRRLWLPQACRPVWLPLITSTCRHSILK